MSLSTCPSWGARAHNLEVIRTIDAGAPCYVVKLAPSDVTDPRRFGFYEGDWWRIEGDHEGATEDRLNVSPAWGARSRHGINPLPRFAGGGRYAPALKLIITNKDDPEAIGTFRNSTWKVEANA